MQEVRPGGNKQQKADAKIKEETAEGSGPRVTAAAAAAAGPAPARWVPATRGQPGGPRLRGGRASPPAAAPGHRVGSPYRPHRLGQHIPLIPSLSRSPRQLTGRSLRALGTGTAGALPRGARAPPGFVPGGVGAASAVGLGPGGPRRLWHLPPGRLRKPQAPGLERWPGTKPGP